MSYFILIFAIILLAASALTVWKISSSHRRLAHEIRNSLSLVKASAESLKERLGHSADDTVVRELDMLNRSADKLSALLDSFGGINAETDVSPLLPPRINVPGTGKAVLLIEKDRDLSDYLCTSMEGSFNVYPAYGEPEAKEILDSAAPDLVLCDVDTGSTGLFGFCSKLKSSPETAHLPLVVISDNSGQDARVDALNHGAEAVFSKPFSIAELTGAMRSLLENRDRVKDALSERPAVSADKDFMESLEKIMEAHLSDENLSVDVLAAEACMSSSSLFKKLKALTGMSPGEYITASRMKEAASLMKNTALTIDDISIKVGFRSHSYFSTCFKNRFGMSPKKFRELSGPSAGL